MRKEKDARFETDFPLRPEETIVWRGRPRQGIYLVTEDWVKVPFFIAWSVFAFGWPYQAFEQYQSGKDDWVFLAISGIPFILVGVYILVGRFIHESYKRKHTWYAVTNQRALIQTKTFGRVKRSEIALSQLPQLNVTTTGRGLMTIEFGERLRHGKFVTLPPTFEQIEDGRDVLRLLHRD